MMESVLEQGRRKEPPPTPYTHTQPSASHTAASDRRHEIGKSSVVGLGLGGGFVVVLRTGGIYKREL